MIDSTEAVIVRAPGEKARIEEIRLDPPGPGEILVRILATGVCHSDLHAKLGHMGRSFPFLLGHEATGVVEAVGEGVKSPSIGDTVVMNWRAPCGRCRFCLQGRRSHCRRPVTAGPRMHTKDGQALGRVLGLGTFCRHTVVAAGQAIVVDPKLSPAATCLVGCAVATGVGAVLFAAGVKAGESVAVFGCGAVGLSVVQGARLAHARQIIAIDLVASKLELARRFGATDTVDASSEDVVERVRSLSGEGVDHAFEAIGRPETLSQALASCGLAGSATLIGVPKPGSELTIPLADLFYGRRSLRPTFYGDCLPSRDFPQLCDWYSSGALDLDGMISEHIGLEDVEQAFEKMLRGETVRSVIIF